MYAELDIDVEALADEIARYLATVDVFRAENCAPTWRPEGGSSTIERESPRPAPHIETSAH